MKTKTKKQLNLPQLIEWAWENPKQVERRTFKSDKRDSFGKNAEIYFTNCGHGFYTHRVTDKDTFTVEVEEEITEDTVFPKLVERWKHDGEGDEAFRYAGHDDKSINRVLFANPESVETTHFYIENDNQELVLIWRDGKLI